MVATYEYALIRVVPDRRRGEWANVGLVVFLADRLDVRIHRNFTKLRALAPTFNISSLESIPSTWQQLTAGFETTQDRHAMLQHLPVAGVSGLAQFMCQEGAYEDAVNRILRDLVVPMPAERDAPAQSRLQTQLKQIFRQAKLLGGPDDIDLHRVVPRFPIEAEAGLFADFALRNGSLRITETLDLRVRPEQLRGPKRGEAALKAVTLDRAVSLHTSCVPSVVYAASEQTIDLIQPSLNLLSDYATRLYDANNRQDMADYMTMMHEAARH